MKTKKTKPKREVKNPESISIKLNGFYYSSASKKYNIDEQLNFFLSTFDLIQQRIGTVDKGRSYCG